MKEAAGDGLAPRFVGLGLSKRSDRARRLMVELLDACAQQRCLLRFFAEGLLQRARFERQRDKAAAGARDAQEARLLDRRHVLRERGHQRAR